MPDPASASKGHAVYAACRLTLSIAILFRSSSVCFSSCSVCWRSCAASFMPNSCGPRNKGPVTGDFVMLDGLSGCDQASIHNFPGLGLAHDFLAFLDKAFDGFAGAAAGALVHQLEDALKALNLTFGLLKVMLKCLLELRSCRVLRHFRQGFQDLLFPVIDVLKRG